MIDRLTERGVVMVHARYRQPGGEDVSVTAEAAALRAAGVPVRLLEVPPLTGEGPAAALAALWNRAVARRLGALLAEARPALVHVQNLWPAASPAVLATARAAGLPLVVTLRNGRRLCPAGTLWRDGRPCADCAAGPWPGIRRGCWRGSRAGTLVSAAVHRWHPAWTAVDRVITPSAFLRQALAPVVPPEGVAVVPNRLPPLPAVEDGPRAGVVFAGRPVPEKGLPVLEAAAARLSVPLTVLHDRPVEDVLAAMGRAAVVAVPSLWPEPFGRVALEGMAMGAAVVASAVGGLPEVVGDAGVLVPPGDAAAWADALRRGLREHRRLGALGRARAAALAGDGAAPLVAVYRSVLTAPRSSAETARTAKAGTVLR